MLVVIISECQKKAIKRTRTIMDNFSRRAGSNVWITHITNEGLTALKKELTKSATKNTAVICYKTVGKKRFEKLWTEGRKDVFDQNGYVATNITKKDRIQEIDKYFTSTEAICILVALAALFHDTGKAWDDFQKMVDPGCKGDANYNIRHDFLSLAMFAAFVNKRSAKEWLGDLETANIKIDEKKLNRIIRDRNPYKYLCCQLSRVVGWLILTHHKMPNAIGICNKEKHLPSLIGSNLKNFIEHQKQPYHYYFKDDGGKLVFSAGHVWDSSGDWKKMCSRFAGRALRFIQSNPETHNERFIDRLVLTLARLSLVIGDWQYSRLDKTQYEKASGFLFAKSPNAQGETPQYLDEHLLGVLRESLAVVYKLEAIHRELYTTGPHKSLRRKSPKKFEHQDKAVRHIKSKYDVRYGFLCFNQAGTGTGKTFANAKMMDSIHDGRLRYTLALGLRSLTLQTGTEYRSKIGLSGSDLAVVIGEKVIQELYEEGLSDFVNEHEPEKSWNLEEELDMADDILASVLKSAKSRQILYSPVLVATIDHLIGSTEDTDRGRFLLPMLRMLSSDLVIDEVDDFDGNDMAAVLRLIHLAGMFGRNVILSSATIPPEDAQAAYNAYLAGRNVYVRNTADSKEIEEGVFCLWCDEYSVKSTIMKDNKGFIEEHRKFIDMRIERIFEDEARRQYYVIDNDKSNTFDRIRESINHLHARNCYIQYEGAYVSFGVIRLANISSVVNLSIGLLTNESGREDTCFVVMPYHSRYPLIQRNEIEKELDGNLKRNNDNTVLSERVKRIVEEKSVLGYLNVVFVVVATPVEEVGRDHDFDWGILEVSSVRSIIQMIGRILRHRDIVPGCENVAILNRNIRTLNLNASPSKPVPVFTRPGYGTKRVCLGDKTFREDVEDDFGGVLNSVPRIKVWDNNEDFDTLAGLEHHVLHDMLLEKEADKPYAWNHNNYFLGRFHQEHTPFRGGDMSRTLYWTQSRVNATKAEIVECVKGKETGYSSRFILFDFNKLESSVNRLWLDKGYWEILEEKANEKEMDLRSAALDRKYGQFSVPFYWLKGESGEYRLLYNPMLGFWEHSKKTLFLRGEYN